MKKIIFIFIMVGGMVLAFNLAFAGTSEQKAFYENCIDWRIQCCLQKAARSGSRLDNIKKYADLKGRQAAHYKEHKERLIREMVEQNLPMKTYKVERHLIADFFRQHEEGHDK